MSIIDDANKWADDERGTGALVDDRPESEKIKDFRFEEIVASAAPVKWVEKEIEDTRQFPIFDQNGSGSCVAQSLAKVIGIMYWLKHGEYLHFSATHIYQRRWNKPASGMVGANAFEIVRKDGVTLESLVPSQELSDAEMDSAKIAAYKAEVGEIFKISNHVTTPIKNIDTIASIIQTTGKGVMVWFYFSDGLSPKEWSKDVPTIEHPNLPEAGANTARHSVTAVDFLLYKGKKALVIEDSWGLNHGMKGRRIITEDFFKARNIYGGYPTTFVFEDAQSVDPIKPRHRFTVPLEFSKEVVYLTDVIALQNILKYEGFFPKNTQSTGYYGAITAKAVLEWQLKHAVASQSELQELQGRRIGDKSIVILNALYGA